MEIKINHLQHIGLPVTDLKVSEAFYEKLGFKNATSSAFNHNGSAGKMTMMQLDKIIVELKTDVTYQSFHEAQLLNELRGTGIKLGYSINFGREKSVI